MKHLEFKLEYLLLALIVLLALSIRLYELGRIPPSLFIDEIWAAYQPYLFQKGMITLPFYSIIAYLLQGTYFTYSFFGSSILFSRLSTAIYGTLLVVVIYFLAKEMFNSKIGLISATLAAITPWAVIFSRYQIPSMAGVFWFTLAICLIYKGSKIKSLNRLLLCGFGSFSLGLSLFSVVTSRVFVAVFLLGSVFLYLYKTKKLTKQKIMEGSVYFALFLLASAPIICDFLSPSNVSERSFDYSIFSHATNILELVSLLGARFFLQISPDFLVLSGGFSYASSQGFQQNISANGLLKYSTGTVGMLNYYGFLVYPAVFYLLYRIIKKRSTTADKIILWWAFSAMLAAAFAYFDNPNSARAIFGLPALIIIIAIFMWRALSSAIFSLRKSFVRLAVILGMILIVLLPTVYFVQDYFSFYPARSADSFDYGYSEVANFLTETGNWNNTILLYSLPSRNWNLAFYSPEQPVNPDRFIIISNISDLTNYKNKFVQIQDSINFADGTIEYSTRIDQSYGGATSSHIELFSNKEDMVTLSLYSENSTYNPNGYLLSQKVNDSVSVEQRSLSNAFTYGEWHSVKLVIEPTLLSFYFDSALLKTMPRPNPDAYSTMKLSVESGEGSFTDLKVVNNNLIQNLSNLDDISTWQVISGSWTIRDNFIQGGASIILIADSSLSLQYLEEDDVDFNVIKTVYYPSGDIALRVFLIS
jgi:4-amino-4-deoxy-L-arabinose transferase-like glycosyltransferase